MRQTLREQIDSNKRRSVVYASLLVVLLAALGVAIWGSYDPDTWWMGGVLAGAVGLILALVARYAGSGIVLSISHAREATPQEDQILRNVAEEMAIAAGIPMPRVFVIDDSALNAFATGPDPEHATVVYTTGLIEKLDRDELQGVMAHEISHIRNYDIRFMTTIVMVAGLVPLIADMFRTSLWWGGGRRRSSDNNNGLQAVFMIIAVVLSILAPIFAKLIELAVSREREYLADASAAELTRYPDGLARALLKISSDHEVLEAANRATQHMYIVNPFKAFEERASALLSTHPPVEDRVRRLRGLMGSTAQISQASDPASW